MTTALNYVHQAGVFSPRNARPVSVIGAGAVGSEVCNAFCKVGVGDLTVWDDDTVASHNGTMSAYGPDDIGRFKVRALADIIRRNSGVSIKTHEKRYEGERLPKGTAVSCVHDMPARKLLWEHVRMNPGCDLFLDTRTAAAYIEVYAINPCDRKDIDRYEMTLFEESERVMHSCGHHGIFYGSLMAASAVVANATRYWSSGGKQWRFALRCDTLQIAA